MVSIFDLKAKYLVNDGASELLEIQQDKTRLMRLVLFFLLMKRIEIT